MQQEIVLAAVGTVTSLASALAAFAEVVMATGSTSAGIFAAGTGLASAVVSGRDAVNGLLFQPTQEKTDAFLRHLARGVADDRQFADEFSKGMKDPEIGPGLADSIAARARDACEAHSEEVIPSLALLMRDHLKTGGRPDATARAFRRVLLDLEPDEYQFLRRVPREAETHLGGLGGGLRVSVQPGPAGLAERVVDLSEGAGRPARSVRCDWRPGTTDRVLGLLEREGLANSAGIGDTSVDVLPDR